MKIAIFGSCVSRDTAEFIPEAEVLTYVARHSATSLESPHGMKDINLSELNSAFQKRMITSDLNGTGVDRIIQNAKDLDVVLIDLVDERRGFWRFPDGTTMTNSIEVESCGAARDARRRGAHLVEFGTKEHFEAWKSSYRRLIADLSSAGLSEKVVLLEIDWAAVIEGSRHPSRAWPLSKLSRTLRRLQRGRREASRALAQGHGPRHIWLRLLNVPPTEAESYAQSAQSANLAYRQYFKFAHELGSRVIRREAKHLRIDPHHKWGPEPYHYRALDYKSIAEELSRIVKCMEM